MLNLLLESTSRIEWREMHLDVAGIVARPVRHDTVRMHASAEGERAADRIFARRRPVNANLAGKAGMEMLSWYARTSADPADFRLAVGFAIFEDVAVFRLAHSRCVIDRTAAHVAAVTLGSVFYVVRAGAVVLSQNGREIPLGAGSSAVASGEAPHQLRIPESAEMILVIVRKGAFYGGGLAEPQPRQFPTTSVSHGVSLFLQALALDFPVPSSIEGVTSQQMILSLLTGLVISSSEGPQRSLQRHLWLESALTFIAANYGNSRLTTADVATATGISSRHLQRLFASAESSVQGELRRTRVRWASTWLEETRARRLDEIAVAAGFGTAASMRRAFRRQTGISPMQYRASLDVDELS